MQLRAAAACTSVGRTLESACTAIRAGITRPIRSREIATLDADTQDETGIRAHPVLPITEGFVGMGRWLRLAHAALADLLRGEQKVAQPTPTALIVATRTLDDEVLDAAGYDVTSASQLERFIDHAFLEPLCRGSQLPIPLESRHIHARGDVALAAALTQARDVLVTGTAGSALIVAVDSWMDPAALAKASERGRVRSFDRPVGLIPGEAAVAFRVDAAPASATAQTPNVVIDDIVMVPATDDAVANPEAAAPALASAIERAGASGDIGDIVLDLTGEDWRARQWGTALPRIGRSIEAARVLLPATSLGAVGAASAGIGVALGMQALMRDWSRSDRVVVASAAPNGEASALLLRRT